MADMRTARGGDPDRREQTQQYVSSTIPPQSVRASAPRRTVTALVTINLTDVDFTRVRTVVHAALAGITPTVALEIVIPGDSAVVKTTAAALREFGHRGNVHVRSDSAWAADMLACKLDPDRVPTVPRYDPYDDPWAPRDRAVMG